MKRYILTILLFFTLFFSNSTNNIITINHDQNGFLYEELGTYYYQFPDMTYIKIRAYVWKRTNRSGYYPQHRYEYILTAVSESFNGNRLTQTWLYENKLYIDGLELTKNQFPYGLTTYIDIKPTALYTLYTSDEKIGKFRMEWQNAVYENR